MTEIITISIQTNNMTTSVAKEAITCIFVQKYIITSAVFRGCGRSFQHLEAAKRKLPLSAVIISSHYISIDK